jgi:tRNA 2-thiouridine synthesizing protein E
MGSKIKQDETLVLSEEGFLSDSSNWNEDVARKLAEREGFDQLDSEQLAIVTKMREHYSKHRSFPILASICKKAGSSRKDCIARRFHNPMSAWKIAGLPKPSNIFFTSFDGKRYVPNPFY